MKAILACCIAFLLFSCHDTAKPAQAPPSPEKAMQEAIRLFPDSPLLRENLIQFYRDSGYYDKALRETFESLKKDSLQPRWWYIAATLYCEKGDTSEAIATLKKNPNLSLDKMSTVLLSTLLAYRKDSLSLAFSDNLMTSLMDAAKEGYFIKGLYYFKTGQLNTALHMLDSCLLQSYTFMDAYREKALVLGTMNKWVQAADVMNKAVTVQNNYAEGHYLLGYCLEKTGNTDEATDAYETALRYDPTFAEAREALQRMENMKSR